ncbi:hypothetical protein, partial [Methylorubrum rhodesianum]|uniref:hypothetical protein n=1 Tax=Methylorubrum rhodesianum TaxID=29427 RepID=UPI001AED2260
VILCAGVEIARHPRSYGSGVFVAEPLHYLALIETKPGSVRGRGVNSRTALAGIGVAIGPCG